MDSETSTSQQDAKTIECLCLKETFWQDVRVLVIAVTPLYKVLRMTDMEGSTLGLTPSLHERGYLGIEASLVLDVRPRRMVSNEHQF